MSEVLYRPRSIAGEPNASQDDRVEERQVPEKPEVGGVGVGEGTDALHSPAVESGHSLQLERQQGSDQRRTQGKRHANTDGAVAQQGGRAPGVEQQGTEEAG